MSQDNSQDNGQEPKEEMRQCPTCRMKVSVWATKCHYCGEEVGRPRREEMKLTLKDLGGESKTSYAPSGNVTGALESFRAEEASTVEAMLASRRKVSFLDRLMGKKPPQPMPERRPTEGTMEMDEYSRNLTASILGDMPYSSSTSISRANLPQQNQNGLAETGKKLVMLIVALLVLYFGGSFAWARISDFIENRNKVADVVYVNRAAEMLARNEEPITAFEEAMTALSYNETDENIRIANEIRALILKEVDALMKANPWRSADQDKAYAIVQRAIKVDHHDSVKAYFESVSKEVNQFKFVLKEVDADADKATFRLNNPDYEPEVTVGVADRLMDRFIITRISSREVELNDDKVAGRKLSIALNQGVRSRY